MQRSQGTEKNTPHFKSVLKVKPTRLLTLFFIGTCLSLLFILFSLHYGMIYLFQQHFISEAKRDSIVVASGLKRLENKSLKTLTTLNSTKINQKFSKAFDTRMRNHLKAFDVLKIKIFNLNYKIVYSTDQKIIGQIDTNNKGLISAISGQVIPHYKKSSQFTDLKNETKFNVDVVETYLPMYSSDGHIIGAFEVYLDITQYRIAAIRFANLSVIIMGILLFFTFSFLFLLMRRGVKQINQYESILSELAIKDPLTGLFNRRELMSRANDEFQRAKRRLEANSANNINLGVIMLDIDFFKKINDKYGHLVGDEILKMISERIQQALRQYDFLGRYGGEEFLIILVDADAKTIKMIAERIWTNIRTLPFACFDNNLSVTASLGVTTVNKNDDSIKDSVERADQALYKAKESDRDQIQANDSCCEKGVCTSD